MVNFNLEHCLRFNIKGLQNVGLYSPKPTYFSTPLYVIFTILVQIGLVFLLTLSMILHICFFAVDVASFTENGYVVLACIIAVVKGYYMVSKNTDLKKLVKGIDKNLELSDERHQIIEKYFKIWHVAYWYYAFGVPVFCCGLWALYPLLASSENRKVLPFPAWYPFDAFHGYKYYLCFLHQMVAVFCLALGSAHTDTILAGLLAYIAAECKVLNALVRNFKKPANAEDIISAFAHIVQYHRNLLKYGKDAEKFINGFIMFQMGVSALSLAMTSFNMTLLPLGSVQFFSIFAFQCAIAIELLLYCYFGNEVIQISDQLSYVAFECDWTEGSLAFQKNLVFFIHRAQKPIKVYAENFFLLSLATYTAILRNAYSYFTLLRQVQDN